MNTMFQRIRYLTEPQGYTSIKILFFIAVCSVSNASWSDENVVDLNGFRLWQMKEVVGKTFGKPYRSIEQDKKTIDVFLLPEGGYMVFGYRKNFPSNIESIQITGNVKTMVPFKGLVIGDKKEKVINQLGKPSSKKKITDPKVTEYGYDNTNYSVEIDDKNRLESIRISIDADMMTKANDDKPFDTLVAALDAHDIHAVIELLRPDVEIYRDGNTFSIEKPFNKFIDAPDDIFFQNLLNDENSLLQQAKKFQPEENIRVTEDIGIGLVYKFPETSVIKEVVFFPFNGKYRLYELAFRGPGLRKDYPVTNAADACDMMKKSSSPKEFFDKVYKDQGIESPADSACPKSKQN